MVIVGVVVKVGVGVGLTVDVGVSVGVSVTVIVGVKVGVGLGVDVGNISWMYNGVSVAKGVVMIFFLNHRPRLGHDLSRNYHYLFLQIPLLMV